MPCTVGADSISARGSMRQRKPRGGVKTAWRRTTSAASQQSWPAHAVVCPAGANIVRSPISLRSTVGPRSQPRTSAGRRGRRPLQHNPQGFSLPQTSAAAWGQAALHPTLPHSVGRAFARNSFTPPCRGRACPALHSASLPVSGQPPYCCGPELSGPYASSTTPPFTITIFPLVRAKAAVSQVVTIVWCSPMRVKR